MNNLQLLIDAGLILAGNLPDAGSITAINDLGEADVQALIRIYQAVGSPFLVNNCNPGGSVGPQSGVRTIGIVF